MSTLSDKKQELQDAIKARNDLQKQLSELPSLKRSLVQELAGVSSKSERKRLKERLDDLATDEIVLPLQLEESSFRVQEAEQAALLAEAAQLQAEAKPLSDEGYEARSKREYWQQVENTKLSEADAKHNRAQRLRMDAAEIGRQLAAKRQQAQAREEVAERDRQGLEPRVQPATRGSEVVFDTLR